jgi:hypothetical protein
MYNPNNQNYSAVYRNTGTTPRRLNRVEDAFTIHTYKTELQDAKDFFSGFLTVGFLVVLIVLIASFFITL